MTSVGAYVVTRLPNAPAIAQYTYCNVGVLNVTLKNNGGSWGFTSPPPLGAPPVSLVAAHRGAVMNYFYYDP